MLCKYNKDICKDESVKKSKKSFFGFWTKVRDFDSAKSATKLGAVISGYLAFSYGTNLLVMINDGETLNGLVLEDQFEHYIKIILHLVVVMFSIFMAYRIHKNEKFGSVPYLAVWLLVEIALKLLASPGKNLIVSIIFSFLAINSLVGWFGIKKYGKLALNQSNG